MGGFRIHARRAAGVVLATDALSQSDIRKALQGADVLQVSVEPAVELRYCEH